MVVFLQIFIIGIHFAAQAQGVLDLGLVNPVQ